jgi:hypothetical protein
MASYALPERVDIWFLRRILPQMKVDSTQWIDTAVIQISRPRWDDDPEWRRLVEVQIGGRTAFRSLMSYPTAGSVQLRGAGGFEDDSPQSYIWIQSDSGGSGGYSTTYLFHADDSGEFLPVATLENGMFAEDHWIQADLSYRYWLTSGAASPVPRLQAIPRAGQLRFLDSDASSGPTEAELSSLLSRVRETQATATDSDLIIGPSLRGFLDLVYAGRARDAWRFLDACFDARLAELLESGAVSDMPRSREAFKQVLAQQLRRSPFHDELLRRNGGSIEPPDR